MIDISDCRRNIISHLTPAEPANNTLLLDTLGKLVARATQMIAKTETPEHNACAFDEQTTGLTQQQLAHHLHLCKDRVRPGDIDRCDLRSVSGKG